MNLYGSTVEDVLMYKKPPRCGTLRVMRNGKINAIRETIAPQGKNSSAPSDEKTKCSAAQRSDRHFVITHAGNNQPAVDIAD